MPRSSKKLLDQALANSDKFDKIWEELPERAIFIPSVSGYLDVEKLIDDQYEAALGKEEIHFLNHALINIIRVVQNLYWQNMEETGWNKRKATGLTILELETILVKLGAKEISGEGRADV